MILGGEGGNFSDVMVECSYSQAGKAAKNLWRYIMEKKTIGKFIAVLRKANGMTQKELGDKLYVSDKTISRWERDECAPELSLIPAIADFFGITTDELLRGERNSPETVTETQNDETPQKSSLKGEKQFKIMLHTRLRMYKNLSLISVGLLILGLLAAIVCNVVFAEALLGFWLSVLFVVASTLCQLIFAANARIPIDDDDDTFTAKIYTANSEITKIAIALFYGIFAVLTFCIPLAEYGIYTHHYMLYTSKWILEGLSYTAVIFAVCSLIHLLIIKPILIKRRLLYFTEDKIRKIDFRRKILGKITLIGGPILAVLIVANFVWIGVGSERLAKKEIYETLDAFKAALAEDQAEYVEFMRRTHYIDTEGNIVYIHSDLPDDHMLEHATLTDTAGNLIEYDYNKTLYYKIEFSNHGDRIPVTIITDEAIYDAMSLWNAVSQIIALFVCIDLATCITVYFVKAYGKKSKKI